MTARAEMVSIINDIRIGYGRGQGTLGEVRDRVMEIARRAIAEEEALEAACMLNKCEHKRPWDYAPCEEANDHQRTQRHARIECPYAQSDDASDAEAHIGRSKDVHTVATSSADLDAKDAHR